MSKNIDKNWFKIAIRDAGFKSMTEFGKMVNLDSTKLSNILRGIRRVQPHEIDIFAMTLNKNPSEIRVALGETIEPSPLINISGYVGAADRVILYDNDSEIFADEKIQLPFFYYKGIVLEIRGESMLPRYNPGELIGITMPNEKYIHNSLIGKDVVAYLPDGRLVLKVLHPGSAKGKYTLVSLNSNVPPIVDTDLLWATNIDFLIPKARYQI